MRAGRRRGGAGVKGCNALEVLNPMLDLRWDEHVGAQRRISDGAQDAVELVRRVVLLD
jgi:hypothetical protein